MNIKFEHSGFNAAGERLYDLVIEGKIHASGLTIDEVVYRINRTDEECLGELRINCPEEFLPRHSRR